MTGSVLAYAAAEIFDGETTLCDHAVVVDSGLVVAVSPRSELPPDCQMHDLGEGLLAPGFVDLQVNGGGGLLLNEAPSAATIETICRAHAPSGTTALLPTLITSDRETTTAAIRAGQAAAARQIPGFAGLHLEGPHLDVAKKGAHRPDLIRPMMREDRGELIEAAATLPNLLLTVAPQSVSNEDIAMLVEAGAIVSLGHSSATMESATSAVEAGASVVTHLFNAMSGLNHRGAGMVGAALEDGRLSVGLICDGIHVEAPAIRIALRAKTGPGRIFIVTDAMSTIGTDLTEFELEGRTVRRQDGALRLADGTLAGCGIDMITAVRFLISDIGVDRDEALRMASLYPAKVLHRDREIGRLVPGARADMVHLRNDMTVAAVWIGGDRQA